MVLLCILIVVTIALLFPKNTYRVFHYKINDITSSSIIAPFDFPILKSDRELETDRLEALKQVPFFFKQDKNIAEQQIRLLNKFISDIDKLRTLKNKYDESRKTTERRENSGSVLLDSTAYFGTLKTFYSQYKIDRNSLIEKIFIAGTESELPPGGSGTIFPALKKIIGDLYSLQILDVPKTDILSGKIALRNNGEELFIPVEQVLTLEEAWTRAKQSLQQRFGMDQINLLSASYDIIVNFLKPNLISLSDVTDSRQKEAIAKVPISKGVVLENEKIVDANTKITPEIFQKLTSLSKERAKQVNLQKPWRINLPLLGDPLIFLGQIIFIGIIFSFFWAFLYVYRPEAISNPKLLILIGITFVIQTLCAALFVEHLEISEYAIPVTLAAMTMTILFDSRIALVGTGTLCLILGAQIGGNVNFVINSLFVSTLAIYSVRQLRKRSQVFQSLIFIVLGYGVSIVVTESLRFATLAEVLDKLLYATTNGVLAPFLTYGIIGFLETIFGITTDLSLLELADFNHPLLKLLSREATGTFTHCVTVGNLAEAAADTIGANALLARVGSYYHDIGKVTKPEYFIENQAFDYNRHDKLTPNLSAIIIINHVKEGIRLANEYKLPQAILDFIPSHHGTTRVEYFYNKALEQAEDTAEVNESDFRYPGPKPRTRETGIVMICETIEAVCRTLDKPSISNIEKVIDSMIAKRLKEGQFDECPLTLADLTKIKGNLKEGTGILPILKGIHHLRVEYPGQENGLPETKNDATESD